MTQGQPVWSAATGKLYGTDYFTQGPDFSPLQEIDPATGRVVREVVHNARGPFAMSPDGRFVAYTVRTSDHSTLTYRLLVTDGRSTISLGRGAFTRMAW